MKRRLVTMALVMTFLLNVLSGSVLAEGDKFYIQYDGMIHRYKGPFVNLIMDGEKITTGDMPAIIMTETIEGKNYSRTLVPVREVCESPQLGATVEWNGPKQEVYISYKDKFIVLKINDQKATVNNETVMLDVPAKIIQDVSKPYGKTMVPLRFVVETFGYGVEWEGSTATATMKKLGSEGDTNAGDTHTGDTNTDDTTTDDMNTDDTNTGDTNTDTNEQGENIDTLSSGTAAKALPTPLKDNPVAWMATSEQLQEIAKLGEETAITKKLQPTTKVQKVYYEEDQMKKGFVVEASSAITDVSYHYFNGRFIVDVENAKWDMLDYEQIFDDNPIITSVRSSQFKNNPYVTRVVFDLKGQGYKFNVSLSEDRKNIHVDLKSNTIYGVELGQNGKGDFIKIQGVISPAVKAFRLSNPDRIVFDVPNSQTLLYSKTSTALGQYVTAIRTAQFNEKTTRVVIETEGQADFDIEQLDGGSTIIQILEPSYTNITYTNYDNPTIQLDKNGTTIDFDKIIYNNDYINRESTIILPGDYSKVFGKGNIKVNDGIIESVDIHSKDGKTRLHIKANRVYEFRIMEEENKLYLKAFKPKELYSKIVVLDAGHGGEDPGAQHNGLNEKDLNLDMVLYAKEYLDQRDDIKVYYTRTNDTYPTLTERAELANDIGADFFVSVHNNSFGTKAHGTETHYLSYSDTPALNSYELADIFHDAMIKQLDMYDRGTKQSNFFVLRETDMPAVLLEVAFVSNVEDAKKLKSESFKKKLGQSVYNAIVETFEEYPTGR